MTINEAITLADQLKPNMMKTAVKVRFLNEIENKVHREILMKHVHTEEEAIQPHYDNDTDQGTVMLVPAPYDMLYVYWIMAKIDELNQEEEKFNNDWARMKNEWDNFSDYYTQGHMPLTAKTHFLL